MTTRVTSGWWLLSATRTRLTSGLSTATWLGVVDDVFGKSRTRRRGRSLLSVTPTGSSRPLPTSVIVVAAAVLLVVMRSMTVAALVGADFVFSMLSVTRL